MNKAKVTASILLILTITITFSFFALLQKPEQPKVEDERGYITSEYVTCRSLDVWQFQEILTLVNDTEATYINFYLWTYNKTSEIVTKTMVDSWRVNYTTVLVYNNTDAATAIQWAFDHAERTIKFSSGTYNISKILLLENNLDLIGNGARFIASNLTTIIKVTQANHISITNFYFENARVEVDIR